MEQYRITMGGKIKTQRFRTNDLSQDSGKQFEMGRSWCSDFLEIDETLTEYSIILTFKSLLVEHQNLDNKQIELKLSTVTNRGDRKAYANGQNGQSQIKELFIFDLGLTMANLNDYFAIFKTDRNEYLLYYVPELMCKNFISLFINNIPDVSVCAQPTIAPDSIPDTFRPLLTAIRTKPFILLAGISGTGKSRIVRELARACSGDYDSQKPQNFEMIQVKPNWHDSSDILGYVSRVSGTPVFVAGDFLKFVVKAWEYPETPYFLCLDEMNLAPVEQYFAEFLSVFESRKLNDEGEISTDPILKPEFEKINPEDGTPNLKLWYSNLIGELLSGCPTNQLFALKMKFETVGISLPQNLVIVGTVNMDETTFSFSRKVLDRAMTIEMNKVDLRSGLDNKHESIGKISKNEIIADSVEGVDIYQDNKEVCDQVLDFLQKVNDVLEGSPFKIAYRTRNEFLIYVVNNLPYKKDNNGVNLTNNQNIGRSLDEITCMKILPRIEGDEEKTSKVLDKLEIVLKEQFADFWGDGFDDNKSIALKKIDEMKKRLVSGYTSFWS